MIHWIEFVLKEIRIACHRPVVGQCKANIAIDMVFIVPARAGSCAVAKSAARPGVDGSILREISFVLRRSIRRLSVSFCLVVVLDAVIRYLLCSFREGCNQTGLHPNVCVPENESRIGV